ncbi:MAG: RES family NAD+ phosphorylase [Acidobacteriia bacterium]|nr:RES family NAD+ phosphorylase [Terriglobia bacterium]
MSPTRYISSQQLARELLASGLAGLVHPSVRRKDGTCLVCFRPALVTNVHRGGSVLITFHEPGSPPANSDSA